MLTEIFEVYMARKNWRTFWMDKYRKQQVHCPMPIEQLMQQINIPENLVNGDCELLTIDGCEQLYRDVLRAEEHNGSVDIPYPIHPGIVVGMVLEKMNISQADFARILGVSKSMLNQILHGSRDLTIEMALLIEMISEIPAHVLVRLQADYSLHAARMSILKGNKEQLENEHRQRMQEVAGNFDRFIDLLTTPYYPNPSAWWKVHKDYFSPSVVEIADHIRGEIEYKEQMKKFETE